MATSSELLSIGLKEHRAGRLKQAEEFYRQVLAAEPNHAEAWHFLGVIACKAGKPELAAEYIGKSLSLQPNNAEAQNNLGVALEHQCKPDQALSSYRRAIELEPSSAPFHNNLGNVLMNRGQLDDAIRSFQTAVALKPTYAEAHGNLGIALEQQSRRIDAIACYQRALELKPDYAIVHNNLGRLYKEQGQLENAVACYRRAIEIQPTLAEAHYNLGVLLHDKGQLDNAIPCYRRALEARPKYPEAYYNLGHAFQQQLKLDDAVACYRRAVELSPAYAEAHANLGMVLDLQLKPREALSCFQQALALKPNYVEVYNNLGNTMRDQGQLDEAATCYEQALTLAPSTAEVHCNLACLRLLRGDFEQGWSEYEWRWGTTKLNRRNFPQPRWNGRPLEGQTILLYAEQGLGDTIQFVRYAPIVKSLGATVVVECPKPLRKLLASCPGIDCLLGYGEMLPPFDVHIPLLSLPAVLKTSLGTIPATVPYLFADPQLVAHWRSQLDSQRGFRIGINWHGREGNIAAQKRDVPLEIFTSLAEQPGIVLISLQKGSRQHELTNADDRFQVTQLGPSFDTEHGAFMDTAAVMMNLDLVITTDTSVPHLAGALGVPVWVALPHIPDWRWLLDRNDSPWYPTMRLFRQKSVGDWQTVFAEIQAALASHLKSGA